MFLDCQGEFGRSSTVYVRSTAFDRHDNSYGPFDTPEGIVLGLRDLEPYYELRENWHYNNLVRTWFSLEFIESIINLFCQMYVTAAHIVSTYAGSFTAFVKERIFEPLNMTSSTYLLSEAVRSGEITQAWTSTDNGRRIPHWFDDEVIQLIAGAGGIISSAADMVRNPCRCCSSLLTISGKMG